MGSVYTVLIEKDDDGWLVSEVVELPGCHTQGRTEQELLERTREAIRAYLESDPDPQLTVEFVSVQRLEV